MQNKEFQSFNKIINHMKFRVLENGELITGEEWNFQKLSSPFNRMYFVMEGAAKVTNLENTLDLLPGNVYLVPLGNEFDYECIGSLHKFYIHFRIEYLEGHDLFDGQKQCASLPITTDQIETIMHYAKSDDFGHMVSLEGLFLDIIGKFLHMSSERVNYQIRLTEHNRVLYQYIKQNCSASLRIKDVAAHLDIPMTKLSKSFKQETGDTLKHYIDGLIIRKAQELLLLTDLTVKDVSDELEFLDEFHFSRFFKRYTAISPSKYRLRNNTFK